MTACRSTDRSRGNALGPATWRPIAFATALAMLGTACDKAPISLADASSSDLGVDAQSDSGSEEACVPNDQRNVTCGMCGVRTDTCSNSGLWTLGTCAAEGACTAGTLETRVRPDCGTESRTCGPNCQWGAWTQIAPDRPGVCQYGQSMEYDNLGCTGNFKRYRTCTEQCSWSPVSECGGGCPGGPRRISPADAEEICIPAGEFIFGRNGYSVFQGITTQMSAYYIDRYPATFRRYQECVDAGACTALQPQIYQGVSITDLPSYPGALVWTATYAQAESFCQWDGGRHVATAAQWEKAAKGPYPRQVDLPSTATSCADAPFPSCLGSDVFPAPRVYDNFDDIPQVASYYNVDRMILGFHDWVSDWYTTVVYPYYSQPVDPVYPSTGTTRQQRGYARQNATTFTIHEAQTSIGFGSIRCARNP